MLDGGCGGLGGGRWRTGGIVEFACCIVLLNVPIKQQQAIFSLFQSRYIWQLNMPEMTLEYNVIMWTQCNWHVYFLVYNLPLSKGCMVIIQCLWLLVLRFWLFIHNHRPRHSRLRNPHCSGNYPEAANLCPFQLWLLVRRNTSAPYVPSSTSGMILQLLQLG